MKINDVQQILNITNSEWNIYYELITTSLKTSTLSHMPFFNQIDNVQSISLYSLYPLLFRKEFQLSDQNLKALIPFSHNHFTSLFILDKIYDSQKVEEPIDLLILLEQYSKNMMFLSNEIHPDVTENICKTLTGLYKEKYCYRYNQILPLEEERQYAYDKYSFAKIALKVFQSSSNFPKEQAILEELYASHDYFAYGRQILDDLEDFQQDYKNKQFNIYVNRFLMKYSDKTLPTYDQALFRELLLESKQAFENSLNSLSLEFTYWKNYINFYLTICEKYIN
ncbi:hypothetical protein SK642_0564 [Streptococcus mitis]|uniref:Uncharacterized protein n=1 Tax=Streptococcus mitis TaxID=28037 RepID=A0A081QBK9_STRMT|nr:hypothetical protein [Streptococcus mitis]KEQ40332.1 hypothetical protein SK642_0564 [Streptococcus mitis]